MPSFDTDAARDQWAMDRLTNMLTSGIKSATEADWSHQQTGNKNAARAWRNLAIRLEFLSDLVASGLFDRIKAGGPEWDAIKAYREARDAESEAVVQQDSIWSDPAVRRAVCETIAESEAAPTATDMRAIFGEPVEGRDYDVMPGGEL